jgi:hypothetical protein
MSSLTVQLFVLREAERLIRRELQRMAEKSEDASRQARYFILADFVRVRIARLELRLMTRPGPAKTMSIVEPEDSVLKDLPKFIATVSGRYEEIGLLARSEADVSLAWNCDLGSVENKELMCELLGVQPKPKRKTSQRNK